MNAYSNYASSNQLQYIYTTNGTSLVTTSSSAPNYASLPTFCGPHQFTLETSFPVSGNNYYMSWVFLDSSNQQIAQVTKIGGVSIYSSYTVAYNNGITSYPTGSSVNTTSGANFSVFKVFIQYGYSMMARGYFH